MTETERDGYVYVASSWKNKTTVDATCHVLRSAGFDCYNFTDEDGFNWASIDPKYEGVDSGEIGTAEYVSMLNSPEAWSGYTRDMEALQRATHLILVLPCGKSAHLEAGWAVGQGIQVACMTMGDVKPELMYHMFDAVFENMMDLLSWMGVDD